MASLVVLGSLAGILVASHQDPGLEVQDLTSHAHLIMGAGANSVVVEGANGLLLVDCKPPAQTEPLLTALRAVSELPLRYLIYSHHHRDVSEGGKTQGQGAVTVAHARANERLLDAGHPGAEIVFESTLTIHLDPLTISLYHKGPGHTDGDTVVYVHQDQLLILGDLVSPGRHPIILPEHGASIREWIRVLRTLREDFRGNEDLTVVPAYGTPGSMEIIEAQIEYLEDLIAAMENAHRHGLTLAEARRDAAPLREKYSHYRGNRFEQNLEVAYRETGG